jgi:hypothetical protein
VARYSAAAVAAVGTDVLFDPVHRHVPLCPFREATGLSCPLCGALRAVDEFAHGRVVAATHYNALLLIVALLGAVYLARPACVAYVRQDAVARRVFLIVALLLVTVFTVLRNLPWGHAFRA